MALSENYTYFSNFSLTAAVEQVACSKHTLSIDGEEIPVQFGVSQDRIEIFAVEERGKCPRFYKSPQNQCKPGTEM